MKKIIPFIVAIIICLNINAQITLSHKNGDWCGLWLDKFHVSGYKYVEWRCGPGTSTLNVYNLNNTLLKTIAVPSPTPFVLQQIEYVSENLFDLDNGMEYIAWGYDTTKTNVGNVYVFDETGSTLFFRDSAKIDPMFVNFGSSMNSIFQNREAIYFDGTSTKMRLRMHNAGDFETYNLPGTIPCAGCTAGIVSGLISNKGNNDDDKQEAKFFPNPTSDQLKLKYKLPEGSDLAEIKIYDMQGKLVDEFKVTDTFDFIYLPTNYNNGLYLYSLIVDGKTVKTEKIVLNK